MVKVKVKMYVKVKKMSTKQRKGGEGEERNLGRGRDRVRNRYHDADRRFLPQGAQQEAKRHPEAPTRRTSICRWLALAHIFLFSGRGHTNTVRPILIIHRSARRHCGP